jgi:hypothetical protein
MKAAALALVGLAWGVAGAHANVRLDYAGQLREAGAGNQVPAEAPRGGLEGESVYARIEKAGTSIEAVYALSVGPGAVQAIYVPVFSTPGTSAATVLERSRFYAHLDGIQLTEVTPVTAPPDAPKPPAGAAVFWFKFAANDQQMSQLPGAEFRISYWQPHVASAFLYLPQSLPAKTGAKRDWRFQIIIRSLTSQIPAFAEQVDYERVGDLMFVYPRDAQIVRVRVARSG